MIELTEENVGKPCYSIGFNESPFVADKNYYYYIANGTVAKIGDKIILLYKNKFNGEYMQWKSHQLDSWFFNVENAKNAELVKISNQHNARYQAISDLSLENTSINVHY
jgi:ABC-type Fe3+-citrate transport system substrate-binding protein